MALEPEPQSTPSPRRAYTGDLAIGVFTDDGPWQVDPDNMTWRRGLTGVRADLHAALPVLTRARLLPPGRRLGTSVRHLGGALGLWYTGDRRKGGTASISDLSRRLRVAAEHLGPTYIKLGQIIASGDGIFPPELVAEFKWCRDQVPAEPWPVVERVLIEELGAPIDTVFDIYSVVTIDLANGHGNTGALVLVNYGNLVFTAICSVLPIAIVISAFPVLSAQDGDAFDRTSAGSNRAVMLLSLLSTAVMIAVALPAAHVLTQKSDQVAPLTESFLLFAPGVAGFAIVTNLSRVLFALGKLKLAAIGLVAQQLLPAALSVPMVLLAPPHLAVGALALASSIGQLATAVPMVAATRRLRGSAAVAGLGHATLAGVAAAAAGAAAGLAITLVMPTGGAIYETCAGGVSTILAVGVFGVVAYALDKGDTRAAAARLRRFVRNRT